ncbi:phosphoribosyl-AMP cyclohydrolase [Cytophagaceae bacterium ABcell3]|nr:phosphoribosyl-AMP cyclohydrolase [Cytophagaceae bacterium ABcell3]
MKKEPNVSQKQYLHATLLRLKKVYYICHYMFEPINTNASMFNDKQPLIKNVLEEGTSLNLQFEKRGGLLPVVVQETTTGQILMVASVNKEAFDFTYKNNLAAFYSTSRKCLWIKGASAGNLLKVDNILVDCDQDALVYQVTIIAGGACHTIKENGENRKTCFYRKLISDTESLTFLKGEK